MTDNKELMELEAKLERQNSIDLSEIRIGLKQARAEGRAEAIDFIIKSLDGTLQLIHDKDYILDHLKEKETE